MKEIIKALGFDPLPTAIIMVQLGVIWYFLKKFYDISKNNQKSIIENFNSILKIRENENQTIKESVSNISNIIGEIKNKINYIDQGSVRQQIMMLIHLYPHRNEEIMKLGKKYFIEFNGNYYLTTIFKEWMDNNNLQYPVWWDDIKQ